jgi:RNA-directed DNA polymerase
MQRHLCSVIKDITKHPVTWTRPYIHVAANLYVTPTPILAGRTETAIDDFFTPATLSTTLGGKTFMPHGLFDPALHYGKAIFADQVIKKRKYHTDFTEFTPILDILAAILVYHGVNNMRQARP